MTYKNLLEFEISGGGYIILFSVQKIGKDYLVIVTGGDKPHIGAATLGVIAEQQTVSYAGHKEDVITQSMFKLLIEKCGEGLCILGGVHIDDISEKQIYEVQGICDKAAAKIATFIEDYEKKERSINDRKYNSTDRTKGVVS